MSTTNEQGKAVRKPFAAWLRGKIEYHRGSFTAEDARQAEAVLTVLSHVERITPAELEHLIEWHDACAKFSSQSDNFSGETHHEARAAALREVDELWCDIGARSAPSATQRIDDEGLGLLRRALVFTVINHPDAIKLEREIVAYLRRTDGGKATA